MTRNATGLSLNGQPYRFAGFNVYQANSVSNCSYTMGTGAALDQSLTAIGTGPNYAFRAWFFQFLGTVNGQLNWTVFDHTLAVAAAHGYKVIPTLTNQWGSCESQPNSVYKTLSWYQGGYKLSDGITPLSFRNYVAQIVARYKDDPTILSWQLVNEAEAASSQNGSCQESAAGSALRAFTDDIGGLVKSIDSNHLVNLGSMGSGQCGLAGSNYQYVNGSPANDLCEYHDYGHITTAIPAKLQADIKVCNGINRPTFVGESGIITSDAGSYARRATYYDAKFSAQFGAGVVGELVWSWNLSGSTTSYEVGPGTPTVAVVARYAASSPAPAPVPPPTPSATASPSPTPSATASSSPTPSATASPSPTPSATASPSPTPSATASPSPTPSATASPSPTPSAIAPPSPTPSATASPSPTPSMNTWPSPSPSETPWPLPSSSETPWPLPSSSETPWPSPSPSETTWPSPSPSETTWPSPSPSETPWPLPSSSETPWPLPSSSETPWPSPSESTWPSPSPPDDPRPSPGPSATCSAPWTCEDSFDPNAGTWTVDAGRADLGYKTDSFRSFGRRCQATGASAPTASPTTTPARDGPDIVITIGNGAVIVCAANEPSARVLGSG